VGGADCRPSVEIGRLCPSNSPESPVITGGVGAMKVHIATGVTAIVIWFALFTAGVTIDSTPYRDSPRERPPFASPTPDQYVRLAGLLSFVAFVMGCDPTRFQDLPSLKVGGASKE
jgi:hypothetical protein